MKSSLIAYWLAWPAVCLFTISSAFSQENVLTSVERWQASEPDVLLTATYSRCEVGEDLLRQYNEMTVRTSASERTKLADNMVRYDSTLLSAVILDNAGQKSVYLAKNANKATSTFFRNSVTQKITVPGQDKTFELISNEYTERFASSSLERAGKWTETIPSVAIASAYISEDFDVKCESEKVSFEGFAGSLNSYTTENFRQKLLNGKYIIARIEGMTLENESKEKAILSGVRLIGKVYGTDGLFISNVDISTFSIKRGKDLADYRNAIVFPPIKEKWIGLLSGVTGSAQEENLLPTMVRPNWLDEARKCMEIRNAGILLFLENRTNSGFMDSVTGFFAEFTQEWKDAVQDIRDVINKLPELGGSLGGKVGGEVGAGVGGAIGGSIGALFDMLFLGGADLIGSTLDFTSGLINGKYEKNGDLAGDNLAMAKDLFFITIGGIQLGPDKTLGNLASIGDLWDVLAAIDRMVNPSPEYGGPKVTIDLENNVIYYDGPNGPRVEINIEDEIKSNNQALAKEDIAKHMQGWGEWGDLANKWQGSGVTPGNLPGGTWTTPVQMDKLLRPETGVLTYRGNTVTQSTQDGASISRSGGPITLSVDFGNRSFTGQTKVAEDKSNPDMTWYGFTLDMAGKIDRNGLNGNITRFSNTTTGEGGAPASSSLDGKFYGPNAEGVGGKFTFSPGHGVIVGSFGAKR